MVEYTYDLLDTTMFDLEKKITITNNTVANNTFAEVFLEGADNIPYNYYKVTYVTKPISPPKEAVEKKEETPIDLDEEMELNT